MHDEELTKKEIELKRLDIAKCLFGTFAVTDPVKNAEHLTKKVFELTVLVSKL